MKEIYTKPESKIEEFKTTDVVATSNIENLPGIDD